MIEQGDWITPHYNYEYRFQKPILFYWLVARRLPGGRHRRSRRAFPLGARRPRHRADDLRVRPALGRARDRRWSAARSSRPASATSPSRDRVAARSAARLLHHAGDLGAGSKRCTARIAAAPPAHRAAAPDDCVRRAGCCSAAGDRPRHAHQGARSAWRCPRSSCLVVRAVTRRALLPTRARLDRAVAGSRRARPRWCCCARRAAVVPGDGRRPRHHLSAAASSSARTSSASPPIATTIRRPFWFYVPILLGGLTPVVAAAGAGHPALGSVAARRPPPHRLEWRLLLWAAVPVAVLHALGRQAAALHPAGAAAARPAGGAHADARALPRATPNPAGATCRSSLAITGSAVMLLVLAVLLHRARPLLFALSPTSGLIGTIVIVAPALGLAGVAVVRPPSRPPRRDCDRGDGDAASRCTSRSTRPAATSRCSAWRKIFAASRQTASRRAPIASSSGTWSSTPA